ncbi:DUF2283 domain-containing protein [Candidatus Wolfebacteria bacterium]|uniref:DUF2283 domain-containing protein n=3 Tax=Candidatus Wolfeibacteriota TaxID=1752735 RepID=A0A2M7Q6X3_9BACT|nr:DUF2283 domain-containing protein [Parcubacteria group bacterium]NCO89310.1 DUF2283 domain-containing protein [Candidatus Wolfebacteria bacterium]PIY59176.1 MAG: hypothetical protein COY97_00275 [Candidatus Wolfebacteria bacterium CG_4_10_14_0_8_um_filter_39_64]PJB83476.1 MAG: hypothetical protein CO087_01655 [Candidatus Wolfebacteria bacterium CG_4_9_14_0_8_um_filter_39_46]NCP58477.1 DUF2283 domain-containing protein [Candidatus Wolfebacteria bacterium]
MKSNIKSKNKAKISYEPEADVLMWEIADKPIDFAKEIGNIVVHFTKNNIPVLIEILEASKFLAKAKSLVQKDRGPVKTPALANR